MSTPLGLKKVEQLPVVAIQGCFVRLQPADTFEYALRKFKRRCSREHATPRGFHLTKGQKAKHRKAAAVKRERLRRVASMPVPRHA